MPFQVIGQIFDGTACPGHFIKQFYQLFVDLRIGEESGLLLVEK